MHLDRCRLVRLGGGGGPRALNDPLLVTHAMRNVTSLYLQHNRLTSTAGISSVGGGLVRFSRSTCACSSPHSCHSDCATDRSHTTPYFIHAAVTV